MVESWRDSRKREEGSLISSLASEIEREKVDMNQSRALSCSVVFAVGGSHWRIPFSRLRVVLLETLFYPRLLIPLLVQLSLMRGQQSEEPKVKGLSHD